MISQKTAFFSAAIIFLFTSCQPALPKSVLQCRQLGTSDLSGPCIIDLATRSGVSLICESAKEFRSKCYKEVFNRGLIAKCPNDSCILETARTAIDCNPIRIDSLRLECLTRYDTFENAKILCASQPKELNRFLCLAGLATHKNAPEICKDIPREPQNNPSIKHCYQRTAIENKNPDICNQIPNPTDAKNCVYNAQINSGISVDCSTLEESFKAGCFAKTAEITGNIAECQKISPKSSQFHCINEVIDKYDHPQSACELVRESFSIYESCLSNVSRSIETCQKITDPTLRQTCLDTLAIQSINVIDRKKGDL